MSSATAVQPRALGDVALSVQAVDGPTRLDGFRQAGSMKALFPRAGSRAFQAVLVNTAGGITGGDCFNIDARVGRDAELTLTTQAAERAYRAQSGETGQLRTRLAVDAGARLNWLPQETILFDGCALRRSLCAEMARDARLVLAEPLVFGRAAMGEEVRLGLFHDRIEVRREGEVAFLDAMRLDGDLAAHLARPGIAAGARALVSVLYIAPDAEAKLGHIRAMMPETGGASLIGDDMLFVRALAADSFMLRRFLMPILANLTGESLPRPWMI